MHEEDIPVSSIDDDEQQREEAQDRSRLVVGRVVPASGATEEAHVPSRTVQPAPARVDSVFDLPDPRARRATDEPKDSLAGLPSMERMLTGLLTEIDQELRGAGVWIGGRLDTIKYLVQIARDAGVPRRGPAAAPSPRPLFTNPAPPPPSVQTGELLVNEKAQRPLTCKEHPKQGVHHFESMGQQYGGLLDVRCRYCGAVPQPEGRVTTEQIWDAVEKLLESGSALCAASLTEALRAVGVRVEG